MIDLAVSFSFILYHLTPVTFLFLALIVWRSPQKARYARYWTAFCCASASAWICALTSTLYMPSLYAADIASRFALCSGATATVSYYAFYLSFLDLTETYKRRLRIAVGYVVILFGFFLFTPLFQKSMAWNNSLKVTQPQPGPLLPLYGLFVLYIFGMGAV